MAEVGYRFFDTNPHCEDHSCNLPVNDAIAVPHNDKLGPRNRTWVVRTQRQGRAPNTVRALNVSSIPYNRREGDAPALNDREIDAIVAFLQTLTDARYLKTDLP